MAMTQLGLLVLVIALALFGAPAPAPAQEVLHADLEGIQETPAVSTVAAGEFRARISRDEAFVDYELTYAGLEAAATAAHIHFGQRAVAGGVSAFLCGGGGKPACPASGTVTGTVTAADVIGPAGQGIAAGELAELVRAIREGVAYANVHSSKFPGGEIRGQIKGSSRN